MHVHENFFSEKKISGTKNNDRRVILDDRMAAGFTKVRVQARLQ